MACSEAIDEVIISSGKSQRRHHEFGLQHLLLHCQVSTMNRTRLIANIRTLDGFRTSRDGLEQAKLALAHALKRQAGRGVRGARKYDVQRHTQMSRSAYVVTSVGQTSEPPLAPACARTGKCWRRLRSTRTSRA